ncbi:hypothetical protein V8F06_002482 [Rhypophila decipiens]
MSKQDGSPELLHPPMAIQPSLTPSPEPTPRSIHEMASGDNEDSLPDISLTTTSSADTVTQSQRHSRRAKDDERRRRGVRTHKQRASGAFLLSDGFLNPPSQDRSASSSRRSRNSSEISSRLKAAQHGQTTKGESGGGEAVGLGLGLGLPSDVSSLGKTENKPNHSRDSTTLYAPKRDSLAGDTVVGSSPRTSMGTLDMESAQIVNMALNLSESRRLASRRITSSTPTPPRLTPLPDSTTGGSLRQHLQQQRRVSRTISPKPDRTPRLASGRIPSIHSGLEPEGSYRYHFSQSTLARAQKAKEYIELMAQYRRVLDLLPPLIPPSRSARSSTASPPESPNASVQLFKSHSNDSEVKIGRPYNPLQYIRNRKVRARERRAIDGEAQGFRDVTKVSDWVDEVAKWLATGQFRVPGNRTLPPYGAAEAAGGMASPSGGSRQGSTTGKPKRPRVDWVIEPADVLADVYWLEQNDNKRLVEDRHWRRVFPQAPAPPRPLSREDGGPMITSGPTTTTPTTLNESPAAGQPTVQVVPDGHAHNREHEHLFTSARDRAHQKLRNLRGSHHRQNSSINGRDFLRIHRGSLSESSDTDSDRRRRGRAGTITSSGKDILAKQMEAILAREQRNTDSQPPPFDHETLRMKLSAESATPEREKQDKSRDASVVARHRRMDSRSVEFSDTEKGYFKLKSRPTPPQAQTVSRTSLEVPSSARGRRFSIDYDTSQPNSPDLRAVRDSALVPAIGFDLSPPPSRPSSPSRNPLSRVRSHFRDRSRNRLVEPALSEAEDNTEIPAVPWEKLMDSPMTDKSGLASPERRASRSPLRKVISRGTDASHHSNKSTGSHRLRHEDGSSGLRGLFRGPRIDSVLRSGVSKVSDIIWRKERDDDTSSTSSDESDMEQVRGRTRGSLPLPDSRRAQDAANRSGKTFLEVMPQFEHVPGKSTSKDRSGLYVPSASPSSRPLSRRSSRFDMLKPPKLDVQAASPTPSPPPEAVRGSETPSESGSRKSAAIDGVRAADARLNAVLQFPPQQGSQQFPTASQWSITDRNGNPRPIPGVVSRREAARLRAALLSTGIRARELDRRAKEQLDAPVIATVTTVATQPPSSSSLTWAELTNLCTDPAMKSHLLSRPITVTDLYPVAARVLGQSIQSSAQEWQISSEKFASETAPQLEQCVEQLRGKLAGELTDLTRQAAEEADEAYTDLVTGQRLKVKRVQDFIEKMLRRRRRRFRWVRRAGWLAVEWALVGFMWYVWFVVMIARVVMGLGRGVVGLVKWLLWL